MEPLFGHLTGFSFIFLIFVQASLIYTDLHKNIPWTVFLECYFVFHASTTAIQNARNWKFFTNGPLIVYSITAIPMVIDYWYKKHYETKTSPLWLRIMPAIIAIIFATMLRCLIPDANGDNDCYIGTVLEDYRFVMVFYLAPPFMMVMMAFLLKLVVSYFTDNKYVLVAVVVGLFVVTNWACVYCEQIQTGNQLTNAIVIGLMVIMQLFICKWFLRLRQ